MSSQTFAYVPILYRVHFIHPDVGAAGLFGASVSHPERLVSL
jgi:hypothetical protein